MDLKTYLNEKRGIVNKALRSYFPESQGPERDLIRAMNYSLFAGGKRLRPILCIAGSKAVGGEEMDVMPVACAIELIHTYSLIHDDLPVMDDDDFRRGKPTNHKLFGEAVALLSGDGLLTEAFHLMSRADFSDRLNPHTLLKVINLIADAAGINGMVGGQVVDIQSEGQGVHLSLVEFIHSHKTGALIAASVASGAILGGGKEDQIDAITEYGKKIGLAFQISDDILDIEGDSQIIGKIAGMDAQKGKVTYPAVLGMERSKEFQREMVKKAVRSLEPFDHGADTLRHIAQYIIERKK